MTKTEVQKKPRKKRESKEEKLLKRKLELTDEKLIESYMNGKKGSLKHSSIERYRENIEVIQELVKKEKKMTEKPSIYELLQIPDEIYDIIKNKESWKTASTYGTYINPFYSLTLHSKELKDKDILEPTIVLRWKEISDELTKENNEIYDKKEPNNPEWPKYEEVVKKRDELRANKKVIDTQPWTKYNKYLLLEIITQIYPKRCDLKDVFLRINDEPIEFEIQDKEKNEKKLKEEKKIRKVIGESRVVQEEEDTNYLDIKTNDKGELISMKLIINTFKTDNKGKETQKKIEELIPKELTITIWESIKKFPRKFLLGKLKDGKIYSYESHQAYGEYFSSAFKMYFGVKVMPTNWRKIYITDEVDLNEGGLEEIAKKMGTSIRTIQRIYKKKKELREEVKKVGI